MFGINRKVPFFNTQPSEAELLARADREAAHVAKVEAARRVMAEIGVQDVQPLIKVTRKRQRAIAAANSTVQIV
jgi:4'-phosphopantetheinyl transferase EntD